MAKISYLACLSIVGACVGEPEVELSSIASAINCSTATCGWSTEPTVTTPSGTAYRMYDDSNFAAVVDGFGRRRTFFVHIPRTYDLVNGTDQKVPLIFVFHGGDMNRQDMIDGKWGDHFEEDYAFVIPLGEPDPCDNPSGNGIRQWLQPSVGERTSRNNANCDATEIVDGNGKKRSYWKASIPGSFTDILFVEQLRAMLLARFTKLNPAKVYATGFSAGGGLTFSLACYRSSLFAGFSAVGKSLDTESTRADVDFDGIDETDPDSLVATCGKIDWDAGHATGITSDLWGTSWLLLLGTPIIWSSTRPLAMFNGIPNNTQAEIDTSSQLIRDKNNLGTAYTLTNSYSDVQRDGATTQRRTYTAAAAPSLGSSAFRRFLVTGSDYNTGAGTISSGQHNMPDADECSTLPIKIMTCDYSYTDETIAFWQNQAGLNLDP